MDWEFEMFELTLIVISEVHKPASFVKDFVWPFSAERQMLKGIYGPMAAEVVKSLYSSSSELLMLGF